MQTRISVSTTKQQHTSPRAAVQAPRPEAPSGVKRERKRLQVLLAGLLVLFTANLAFADQFYFTRTKAISTTGETGLFLWDDAAGTQTQIGGSGAVYVRHAVDGALMVDGIAATSAGILYGFAIDDTTNPTLLPTDGTSYCTASMQSRLVTIDTSTAIVTYIGPWTSGQDIAGAGFDAQGRLWALDCTTHAVVQIDPATGGIVGSPIALGSASSFAGDLDFAANGLGIIGYGGLQFLVFNPDTGTVADVAIAAQNQGFDSTLVPPYGISGVAFTGHLEARSGSPAAEACRLNLVEGRADDELGQVNDPFFANPAIAFREAEQVDTLAANGFNAGRGDGARVNGPALPDCFFDWGDAPDDYGTLGANNGAHHLVAADGPYLGAALPDFEVDGVPNAAAQGDDANGGDEDGVTIPALPIGATVQLQVTVGGASTDTRLQGWIDWGRDGSFADAGDQILTDATVTPGLNTVDITVPATAALGTSYARFRIANSSGLTYEGAAETGEVEDYQVALQPPQLDCGADNAITISGNAQAWTPDSTWQTFADNTPVLAINAPDGQGVQLYQAEGNVLTLDLSTVVPEGQGVSVYLSQPANPAVQGDVVVESSVDGAAFAGAVTHTVGAVLPAFEEFIYIVPTGGARFIRITPQDNGQSGTAVRIDALSYSFQFCECAGAVSFVQEGSFEEFTACSLQTGTFGNWSVIEDSIHIWGATCPLGWESPDGANSTDLDGSTTGGLEQVITGLIPGNRYNLTFYQGFNPAAGAASASVHVQIGTLDEVYTSASNATLGGFNSVYVEFTALSETETLRFESLTGSDDPNLLNGGGTAGFGVVIDDVRITPQNCAEVPGNEPRVRVTKSAEPSDTLTPGGPIVYTIAVTNEGVGPADGTTVQDPFPTGIETATWTCAAAGGAVCPNADSGGPVTPPADLLNETIATLPGGSSLTYTVNATVAQDPPERVSNTVSVVPPEGGLCLPELTPPPCTDTTIVPAPVAELVITKTSSPNPAVPGEPLTYTITVVNNGPDDAIGARVLDQVPAPLAAFAWSCTLPSGDCAPASGTGVIDTLVDLPVGATATITLTGTLAADHFGTIENFARVIPPPGYETTCPQDNPNCQIAPEENTPVPPSAELVITKVANPSPAIPGAQLTYTIVATNNGPGAAQGSRVLDAVPPELAGFAWSCVLPTGSCNPASGTGAIDTLVDLTPGAQATITLSGTLPSTAVGEIENTATIEPPPTVTPTCPEENPTCRTTTVTTPLEPRLDIAITQTVDVETGSCAVPDDEVEFIVTAQNLGPSDAANLVVNYALPEGLAFVAAEPSVGTYDSEAGTWQIGALAAGAAERTRALSAAEGRLEQSHGATLHVTAQLLEPGSFAPEAALGSVDPADVNAENNTAAATLEGCGTDVEATEIWWGYNPDHDTFDFYVTVRNNGPQVTDGPITVTIPLPAGMTFAMAEAGWACELEAETNTVACTRFDLAIAPGESIRFAVWSHGETPDAVTVAAHVTYPPDLDPGNNVITLDDCCGRVAERRAAEQAPAPADLAVTQTSAVTTVDLTRHVTYTVNVRNLGPEPTPQIRLSDVLPRGTTLVSATSPQGACHVGPNGLVLACTLNALALEETAAVTITLATLRTGALTHVVSATGVVPDPAVTNNQVKETTLLPPDPALDPEGTGVPTAWRTRYGLEGADAAAAADPDGDGVSNLEEFLRGTHPRGLFRGHFAEGATGFFQTDLGLVNPGEEATEVVLSFLTERGDQLTRAFTLGPGARTTVPLNAVLAGWTTAAATLVESDRAVAADRLMTWPGQEYIHLAMAEDVLVPDYASSLETAVPAPSPTWYFAEGATAGLFDLYYLLQNPADIDVTATIQYLRQGDTPVTRTYSVPAHSRRTIWVDAEPGLDNALIAATVTADAPIVAERAMYFSPAGVFGLAGHAAAGVAQPSPTWHFAEGATGAFFDAFLLLGNPHAAPVSVDVQYQLPTGQGVTKTYVVPAQQRLTVYVDVEDPALAETAFAATVTASAPIVAERAMWWPGPTADQWTEASATLGATTAGTAWAIAEARVGTAGRTEATPGGPTESFVLLSNTSATAGQVRVRLITESGTTVERVVELAAHARRTLALGAEWPALAGQRASVVVESLDPTVPITVEHACYSSIPGHVWTAGAAARATPLP